MRKLIILISCLSLLAGCQYLQPGTEIKPAAQEVNTAKTEIAKTAPAVTKIETLDSKQLESLRGAVVHIFCDSIDPSLTGSSGSGIIYDSKGLILTNNHVIPNNNEYLGTPIEGCLITLPDPKTGLITDNLYYAAPKVVKDISLEFDLATLQIFKVESLKQLKIAPELPSKFPKINISKSCPLEELNLRDKIEVYGYPDVGTEIGTSISLVVTDGIISSFPGDGTILTNAKINEGNSGGLAIREDGCFIGIPSAGYTGAMESYGYIISTDLINKYLKEARNGYILLRGGLANQAINEGLNSGTEVQIQYPAYVRLVSAEDTFNIRGEWRYVLTGNVSGNCTEINVRTVNKDRRINDLTRLKEWQPGDTTFVYRLAPDLNNIGIGYNEVTVTASCQGGQKVTDSMTVTYGL